MNFAARINSFYRDENSSLVNVINEIASVKGITHVDLNYPEHFSGNTNAEIKRVFQKNSIKLNSIALRFRNEFINGEFSNHNMAVSQKAIDLCKQAIDCCKELGGETITIWLGYDGCDYSFQANYSKAWEKVARALREICEYGADLKVSIEYKPFQPRVYSLLPSWGTTMMMINEIGCKNLGVTLDFCHMLMAGENPAYGLCMLAERKKLYGIHLNDGNKLNDDGLIIGSINFLQTLEFVYYLKKYDYAGIVYFDTFPMREDPKLECGANIAMYNKIDQLIENIGMDNIQTIIDKNDGLAIQEILLGCLK